MKKNLRFNRLESKHERHYMKEFKAGRPKGNQRYTGFIKCKLLHHRDYSTIIPDQIYLKGADELLWIQPLFFLPSILAFDAVSGIARIYIDVSHGTCVTVEFQSDWVQCRLRDGSLLYRCNLLSIPALFSYATGTARLTESGPQLRLFHHTTPQAKKAILASSEFFSSSWNMQGNKKLANISYLYLTALKDISHEADLQEIAMASDGKTPLRCDQNFTEVPDVILTVSRESTSNRSQSICSWVDADLLSPQHIYKHSPRDGQTYYGVVSPFISRVGVRPENNIHIKDATLIPLSPKLLEYVIVGDATTIEGLRAPYDEEDTTQILKIAKAHDDGDFISYWRDHANSRVFQSISIEPATWQHQIE